MMKQIFLTALITISTITAFAQDAEVKRLKDEANKTIKKEPEQKEGWTKGGVFNLNLSQGQAATGRQVPNNFLFL